MNDLLEIIYVDGDVIQTACNIFLFGFALEFVLGFCNIIKSGYSSIRR